MRINSLGLLLVLVFSFFPSNQIALSAERARREKPVTDPYQPVEVFEAGKNKGKKIDTFFTRPPIAVTDEAQRKAVGATENDLVFANFYDNKRFWLAKVPKDAVEDVYLLEQNMMPVIPHMLMRFKLKDGKGITLYQQDPGKKMSPTKEPIQEFIFHGVGLYPEGGKFFMPKSLLGHYYNLSTQIQSMPSFQMGNKLGGDLPVAQTRLAANEVVKANLLNEAIKMGQELGYQRKFSLPDQHCHTVGMSVIDKALGRPLNEKGYSQDGWVANPKGLLKHTMPSSQNFLKERGLYDPTYSDVPSLNAEWDAAKPMATVLNLLQPEARARAEKHLERLTEAESHLFGEYEKNVQQGERVSDLLKETNPEKVEGALKKMVPLWKELQEKYDNHMVDRFDFIVDTHADLAVSLADQLMPEIKEKDKKSVKSAKEKLAKKLQDLKSEVLEQQKLYYERKELYGQGKDTMRLDAIRRVIDRTKDIISESDPLLTPGPTEPKRGLIEKAKGVLSTAGWVTKMLPAGLTFAKEVFTSSKKTPERKAPMSNAFVGIFTAMADASGYKVDIKNADKLPNEPGEKEVILYVPEHNQPFLDFMTVGKAGIKDAVMFGAVDNMHLGKFVSDKIAKSDSFITVGRKGKNPIEDTMALINSGKNRKFLIFPEGSISGGAYDTRPIREKFATGLIQRMIDEGYKPTLVPISLPGTLRFENRAGTDAVEGDGKRVTAVIQPKINAETLATIAKATGNMSDVVFLLRQLNFEALENQSPTSQMAGLPSVRSLVGLYDQVHFNGRHCQKPIATIGEAVTEKLNP